MSKTPVHPALKQAPKTLRAALQRALIHVESGQLARHNYRNSKGRKCIIGQFFTPEQLADIEDSHMNRQCIVGLVAYIGEDNLTAMTGLSVDQAKVLQRINDQAQDPTVEISQVLRRILAKKREFVAGVVFDVRPKARTA